MAYEVELGFAKQLAKDAGEIMLQFFRSSEVDIQVKNDKTLVTLADTTINSLVIQRVKSKYASHSVLGEEETFHVENPEFTWVCDPVDGTMPFAKGIPISTFSIALVDSDGQAVLGVVYDPFQDRVFEAVRGNGAFLNGDKLSVSVVAGLEDAYIDQELWVNDVEGVSFDDPKDAFNKAGAKITTLCSAVITGCLVAEGSYDAMIFGQSKPEDIAALSVIVEEAGGRVTDLYGNDQRYDRKILGAVVSNNSIHDQILKVLSNMNYESKNI